MKLISLQSLINTFTFQQLLLKTDKHAPAQTSDESPATTSQECKGEVNEMTSGRQNRFLQGSTYWAKDCGGAAHTFSGSMFSSPMLENNSPAATRLARTRVRSCFRANPPIAQQRWPSGARNRLWSARRKWMRSKKRTTRHNARTIWEETACSGNLKMPYESGKLGHNATHNLHTSSWDTWHPLFPDQTIIDFTTSIVNHFRNKIVSAQRNIHIIQILRTAPPRMGFFICA